MTSDNHVTGPVSDAMERVKVCVERTGAIESGHGVLLTLCRTDDLRAILEAKEQASVQSSMKELQKLGQEFDATAHQREEEISNILATLRPYNGKDNNRGRRAALLKSTEFLRTRYDKARCDHEAVSCCIRCQTMFLVNVMVEFLNDTALRSRVEQHKDIGDGE